MTKLRFTLNTMGVLVLFLAFTTLTNAQATRTWVSGVGDDVNPCSRTAPCKTFAGAISKTATGGEISVLDPGGYGTLTITKAITVDGGTGAGWGSTLAAGLSGFTVNITTNLSTDKVTLRNLSINGNNTAGGFHGIRFLDGAELNVQNVDIFNFTGSGISVAQTQAANVYIRNVNIDRCVNGITLSTTTPGIGGSIIDTTIDGVTTNGIVATNGVFMIVRDVTIARPGGTGVKVDGASGLNCEGVMVQGATTGFETTNASARIRIANSAAYDGNTGLSHTAGNITSAGGNRIDGNAVTNGTITGATAVQ